MMSGKCQYFGIKVMYDLIIPAHGVTNKILSRDSNYIVNVAM